MRKGTLVDFMKEHGKTILDMLSVEFTEAEKKSCLQKTVTNAAGKKAGKKAE